MTILKAFPFAALLAGALLAAPALAAIDAKPAEDASAVLSKASTLVDLKLPGGAPFLLQADVVLHEGKNSVQGVFAMAWAAPGQYRRVLHFPGFSSTEVASNGVLYRQRTTDESLPLMIWQLGQLLDFESAYRPSPAWKPQRVQPEQAEGAALSCVLAQSYMGQRKLCVNAATGVPVSIDEGFDVHSLESLREHTDFADYEPFEGRTYPRKLTFHGWGSRSIEVRVQKLIRVQTFAADEFTAPKGATRSHFCESPEVSGSVNASSGNTVPIGFRNIEVDMYFQVTPAGAVRNAQVVYSSDPIHDKEVLSWFVGTHFPIRTCSGTPVSYETMVRLVTTP